MSSSPDLGRRSTFLWLAAAVALGAAFRFYNLGWAAPYFHFHIDEHFVFGPADLMRRDPRAAALSAKFFMYSPLPMYAVNLVRSAYEALGQPLDLTTQRDQITYMVLGRAISALLGTLSILLVYAIASRIAGRLAGVMSAFLLAFSVIHIRESHFFTVDITMTFFALATWWFLLRIVGGGSLRDTIASGVGLGLGVLSKYTAAFLGPLIALAHLLAMDGPRQIWPLKAWVRPIARTALAGAVGVAVFLLLDPLAVQYYDKFRADIKEQITDPLLGVSKPLWIGHFADVNPVTYWFTNLLWWGLGPALEIWGLAGLIWLFLRRDRLSFLAAAFPVVFWLLAGRSIAPFIRYSVPLAPCLAVAAGVLSADGLRNLRWRRATAVASAVVLASTALWAVAYMNVYRQPDSRLVAARWILDNIPAETKILIEPHHNIPPMGRYLTRVNFYGDHVLWGPPRDRGERHDYYQLHTIDVYQYLYNARRSVDERQRYIDSRLALADWLVMDDTFMQQYAPQSESEHHVVKQYYRDLFAGRLGFQLVKSFKVYPSLFGRTIDDDSAELTFRLFDHPRIFIFRRQ